ncbi:hypothetical protein ABK040_006551 [Willaertia magna]
MVLYKVSLFKKIKNLGHSSYLRLYQFYTQALKFNISSPSLTLHDFTKKQAKVKNWTLITDSLFGGKSSCEMGVSNVSNSIIFRGNLVTLTNNKKVLPSWARMWFLYPLFHLDLSEYEEGGIRIKYRTERPEDFQLQFEYNQFVEDSFFYAPLQPNKFIKNYEKTHFVGASSKSNEEINTYEIIDEHDANKVWKISEIPFSCFHLNTLGDETKVAAIRTAKQGTTIPVFDILALGLGISTYQEGPFEIEIASIEAYDKQKQ